MSHFCGLVILTKNYLKNHTLEDSLAKYDESLEMPEYSCGEVSDYDKVRFIEYYLEEGKIPFNDVHEVLYLELINGKKIEPWNEETDGDRNRYLNRLAHDNKERYAELFIEKNEKQFNAFGELYDKHGDDWNSNKWRVNPMTGKWEEYSTYNKDSKWDWYTEGGRWNGSIKTKSGEFVNKCLLGEIDWTDFKPEDYEEEEKTDWTGEKYKPLKESVTWHFTKSNLPFNIVIDGNWCEKGEMLWWGITSNEMSDKEWEEKFFEIISRLPEDCEVYLEDFHI